MRLRKALPPDARRPQTAAVCVYPSRVADAKVVLQRIHVALPIQIAAGECILLLICFLKNQRRIFFLYTVATGFPSGQFSLESRLIEIRFAIDAGATEIDIVLDRNLVLTGQWSRLYEELVQMRTVCGLHVHMKSILAVGECGTLENVYTASMVAMMAGTDFIKTSTGKETVNATLTFGLVMIRAIQEFRRRTGRLVGLKPAGGVRTVDDAIGWMRLILNTLGETFLEPTYFRFGASGLVDNIASVVQQELSAKLVTPTKVAKKQEMFEKYNGTKLDT